MSRNLGAYTSWNPLGHTWPVTGLVLADMFEDGIQYQKSLHMFRVEKISSPNYTKEVLRTCSAHVHEVTEA
jgi:hypothetical protein